MIKLWLLFNFTIVMYSQKKGCRDFLQLFEWRQNKLPERKIRFIFFKYGIMATILLISRCLIYFIIPHEPWMKSYCRRFFFECQSKWFGYIRHFVNLPLVLWCGSWSDFHPRTLDKSVSIIRCDRQTIYIFVLCHKKLSNSPVTS